MDRDGIYTAILKEELVPALGCTEPACAALSGARLRDELGAIPRKAKVRVSRDMMKNAILAEMAIVYGNRYRFLHNDIDEGLDRASKLFFKGNYESSLKVCIDTLSLVDDNIEGKLKRL